MYDSDDGREGGAQVGTGQMQWCRVCILVNAMDACGETAFAWGEVWMDEIEVQLICKPQATRWSLLGAFKATGKFSEYQSGDSRADLLNLTHDLRQIQYCNHKVT